MRIVKIFSDKRVISTNSCYTSVSTTITDMQLVERHIIKQSHKFYKECDKFCFLSKNLFNYANYLIRQPFINDRTRLSYNTVQKQCQNTPDYLALPAKVSQQVLMKLDEAWKSFAVINKEYYKNPAKFKGRPKLPGYKHKTEGRNLVTYTNQAISKKALKKGLINPSKTDIFIPTKVDNVCQVRIVPKIKYYVIEVVYEKETEQHELDSNTVAGLDIGLNTLGALTSNLKGFKPVLVNGRPLKSINVYFNKKRASLQSKLKGKIYTSNQIQKLTHKRNCKVDNYLHNASRFIVNYLLKHRVGNLVIGKNDGWKQEINLGKRNNQNFVQIPHAKFIEMLQYKCELVGIEVFITEESYTSKCSALDNEPICKHELYLGKRVKRGLFRTADNKFINADINGSLNIIRKVFPNAFVEGIQAVVVQPVRITPYKLN
jgi:putative transposase